VGKLLLYCTLLLLSTAFTLSAQQFELSGSFGVSIPEQPVELERDGTPLQPGMTRVTDQVGRQVPYQILANQNVLVRRGLASGARLSLRIESGTPQFSVPNPVSLRTLGNGDVEVTNGLTGIRIAGTASNPAPFNKLAIRGILLASGTWAAADSGSLYLDPYVTTPSSHVTGYRVSVLENGPLKVTVKAEYDLVVPDMSYLELPLVGADAIADTIIVSGNPYYYLQGVAVSFDGRGGQLPCGLQPNKLYWPTSLKYDGSAQTTKLTLSASRGGPNVDLTCSPSGAPVMRETPRLPGSGTLSITTTVLAGQKTIMIEDETDSWFGYHLNFFTPGVFEPKQIRFKASAADSLACGYSLDDAGKKIRYQPFTEGFVDIDVNRARRADYYCSDLTFRAIPKWYVTNSARNVGIYNVLYDPNAPNRSDAVGIYPGRPSRLHGTVAVGPAFFTHPHHFDSKRPAVGITSFSLRRGPDGNTSERSRREWGLYVGTKADLVDPALPQPIALERNALTGVNLSKLISYGLDFPDPDGGWTFPYSSSHQLENLAAQVKGSSEQEFQRFRSSFAYGCDLLLNAWRRDTPDAYEAVVKDIEDFASTWLNLLVQREGAMSNWWHFYQPMLAWQGRKLSSMVLLSSKKISQGQRQRIKRVVALIASIFSDDDYVPWTDHTHYDHAGNANQNSMYDIYRAQEILSLPSHPKIGQRTVEPVVENFVRDYLDQKSGAPTGSTHYFVPVLDSAINLAILERLKGRDLSQLPIWEKLGAWVVNAQTPPEVRFGAMRKFVSNGDGATENVSITGLLASFLSSSHPMIADQLHWLWKQAPVHSLFATPSVFAIDDRKSGTAPDFRTAHFDGYWSILRTRVNEPGESSVHFINGNHYLDHRHRDSGQISIYANGAPLSIDFNANLYYPRTEGSYIHSRVTLASDLAPHAWNADGIPLDKGSPAWPSLLSGAAAFSTAQVSSAFFQMTATETWSRTVMLSDLFPGFSLTYVSDSFAGANTAANRILTWNLMAQGPVLTPVGIYTPIERLNRWDIDSKLPSSGPDYGLSPGLNLFRFTGHRWPKHLAGGVDARVWIKSPEGRFLIGNWGHDRHPSPEMAQFNAANGRPFEEKQHILRVIGKNAFESLLVTHDKGVDFNQVRVTEETCGTRVRSTDASLCISPSGYTIERSSGRSVASFRSEPIQLDGVRIEGGPAEILLENGRLQVRAGIVAGTRKMILSQGLVPSVPLRFVSGAYEFDVAGSSELTFTVGPPPTATPTATPGPTGTSTVAPGPTVTPPADLSPTPAPTPKVTPPDSSTPSGAIPLDFDGDGLTDVAFSEPRERKVTVLLPNSKSSLSVLYPKRAFHVFGGDFAGTGVAQVGVLSVSVTGAIGIRIAQNGSLSARHATLGRLRNSTLMTGCALANDSSFGGLALRKRRNLYSFKQQGNRLRLTLVTRYLGLRAQSILGCGDLTGDGLAELVRLDPPKVKNGPRTLVVSTLAGSELARLDLSQSYRGRVVFTNKRRGLAPRLGLQLDDSIVFYALSENRLEIAGSIVAPPTNSMTVGRFAASELFGFLSIAPTSGGMKLVSVEGPTETKSLDLPVIAAPGARALPNQELIDLP